MPAKKSRRSAEEVRYLLSGDRKLRRLSLKKISEGVKRARRKTRVAAGPEAVTSDVLPESNAPHPPQPSNAAGIAFALVGLVLLAALVAMWWPAPSTADEQVADEGRGAEVLTADVASAPVVTAKTVATAASARTPAAGATPAPTPVPAPAAKARPAETAVARAESPSVAAPAHASAPTPVVHPAATVEPVDTVTISGCLEYDGKSAWLKDTSGADAPKTRNWRSGFLRKRSPRIALVDAAGSASAYDGRRVSVTGVLVDREMRVNSLKPAAGDCD